jgi:hypothetical protein
MGKAEYFAMMHLVQTDPGLAQKWEDLVEKTRDRYEACDNAVTLTGTAT